MAIFNNDDPYDPDAEFMDKENLLPGEIQEQKADDYREDDVKDFLDELRTQEEDFN